MPQHPPDDEEDSSHSSSHNDNGMMEFEPVEPMDEMGGGGMNGMGIDFEPVDFGGGHSSGHGGSGHSSGHGGKKSGKRPADAESFMTEGQAMVRARELGLSAIHSHETTRGTMYMPGKSHSKLNKALEERGVRPVKMPGR